MSITITLICSNHPRAQAIKYTLSSVLHSGGDVFLVEDSYYNSVRSKIDPKRTIVFDLLDEPEYNKPEGVLGYAKIAPLAGDEAIALPNEWLAVPHDYIPVSAQKGFSFLGRNTYLTFDEKPLFCTPIAAPYRICGFDAYRNKWAYSQRIDWLHQLKEKGVPVLGGLVEGPGELSPERQYAIFGDWTNLRTGVVLGRQAKLMQASALYSLCPAGHGAWSYRAYDAAAMNLVIIGPNLQRPLLAPKPDVVVNPGEPIPTTLPDKPATQPVQYSTITKKDVCAAFTKQIEVLLCES